ncbi:MAG: HAD family hydrolase, partial [Planctomycetaceae bacterium]|nr:HAD family hydrolase [Planctomycetaceae bacterium]
MSRSQNQQAIQLLMTNPLPSVDAALKLLCDRWGGTLASETRFQIETRLEQDLVEYSCYPDVVEFFRILEQRGHRSALISNLSSPYIRAIEKLGLHQLVDRVFYSCDVGAIKPDPAIFEYAL